MTTLTVFELAALKDWLNNQNETYGDPFEPHEIGFDQEMQVKEVICRGCSAKVLYKDLNKDYNPNNFLHEDTCRYLLWKKFLVS